MQPPLIYVICTSQRIARLAIDVDAHVRPTHPVLRYVTAPYDLDGVERGALYIDLLERGQASRDWIGAIKARIGAYEMQPIEIWKLKAKLREFGAE